MKRTVDLASRFLERPVCIEPRELERIRLELARSEVVAYYDDEEDDEEDKDYPVTADGIACIPITGPLTKGYTWRGTSYETILEMCADAYADPRIKGLLLCVDSGGGEASGMFDLTDYLYSMRSEKPTAAISDDSCYSAAYCLASSASHLVVTRTGGVGSIGCWSAHVDFSGMLEKDGVKVTLVFAGDRKVDGNPYEPLSDRAHAQMKEECDRIRTMFVSAVARNRGVDAQALLDTEAGIFMAEKGVPLLADQVGTLEDSLSYLRGQIATKALEAGADPEPPPFGQNAGAWRKVIGSHKVNKPAAKAIATPEALEKFNAAVLAQLRAEMPAELLAEYPQAECAVRVLGTSAAPAAGSRKISGLVVPYGSLSQDFGGFKEVYERGCFAESLSGNHDLRGAFNHNSDYILGRKSASTARFTEQSDGVHFECDAPETSWADDLLVSMRRGDITQSSAAFYILSHRWEVRSGDRVRVIEKALLREASVVSFAMYEATTATVPQANEFEHQQLADRLRLLSAA